MMLAIASSPRVRIMTATIISIIVNPALESGWCTDAEVLAEKVI
jgi:hypothetical protein